MKKGTLVFDVDDVISVHKNRDYENAKPITKVINKVNYLYGIGYYIKLYTARGQNSCNGDIDLIIKRNKKTLVNWLKRHNVLYHELIFGKPLGDWYIDDKAMPLDVFLNAPFETLYGNSGDLIRREHDKAVKSGEKVKKEYEWYNMVNELNIQTFNIPRIYSFTVDTLIMEYIDGELLSNVVNSNHLRKIMSICKQFKLIEGTYQFNIDNYISYMKKCYNDDLLVELISKELKKYRDILKNNASFSHGDLSLNNIIVKDNQLYMIDPGFKEDYSSYLLDLAKIRLSLSGFDKMFNYIDKDLTYLRDYFDELLKKEKLFDVVRILEITRWIRILPFIQKVNKEKVDKVKYVIEKLWREYEKR